MKKHMNVYDDDKCNLYLKNNVKINLNGWSAGLLSGLFKSPIKGIFNRLLMHATGFNSFRSSDIEDEPTSYPFVELDGARLSTGDSAEYIKKINDWPYSTIGDYYAAFKNGTITPRIVAERVIEILSQHEMISLNAVCEFHKQEILDTAEESTQRYKNGTEISKIDGIPFFVKEELQIKGYTTTFGIDHLNYLCDSTAPCIQKILDAGAIFCGYTSMVQLGSNPIGFNPSKNRPSCRNPFNPLHYSGGSSSGSGVVVSAGLCPFAIGVDGFGSVRIPSAMTGIAGIRPTFSRISFQKVGMNSTSPFCSVGVMACCVEDLAIVYALMTTDEYWISQLKDIDMSSVTKITIPSVLLPSLDSFKMKGTKIAICPEYASSANENIISCYNNLCSHLMSQGAEIVYVGIPELKEAFMATSIGMIHNVKKTRFEKIFEESISKTTDANLLSLLAISDLLNDLDIDIVRRQRSRTIKIVQDLFTKADILLLPNSCCTALKILPEDEKHGFVNNHTMNSHLHFQAISSLTGIPAMSINIGYEHETGLPISAQVLAKWWREDLLIVICKEIQSLFPLTKKPEIYFNPLK